MAIGIYGPLLLSYAKGAAPDTGSNTDEDPPIAIALIIKPGYYFYPEEP